MKRLSNILFVASYVILLGSLCAPLVNLEITVEGALINGSLFIIFGLLAGYLYKGSSNIFMLATMIMSYVVLIICLGMKASGIYVADTNYWIMIMSSALGSGAYTYFSYSYN